jgi:hypothetical protein
LSSEGADAANDGAPIDPPGARDANASETTGDAIFDSGLDAAIDTADPCIIAHLHDDFATLDAATWSALGSVSVATPGTVTLVPATNAYASGALFTLAPVPIESFDLTFRFRVDHVSTAAPPSDGWTVSWIHAGDGGSAAPPASTVDRSLGMAPKFSGLGVEYDTYQSVRGYIHLDPTKNPGSYAWEVAGSQVPFPFPLGATHDVRVEYRRGAVRVVFDGVAWTSDAGSIAPFTGWLGFTGHSGFAGDGFYVAVFDVVYYAPVCTDR